MRRFLFVPVSEEVKEEELTKQYRDLVGEPPPPVWRLSGLFPAVGRRISPNLDHGNSEAASRGLAGCLRPDLFTDEARRAIVVGFFSLLQSDDTSSRAARYSQAIETLAAEAVMARGEKVTADRLPAVPAKQ